MFEISSFGWVLLGVAAFFVGISKTALPGLATLSVAIFAAVIPAKESTAVILLLLLTGDLIAIWTYRHDAHWKTLRQLIPPVVVGIIVGSIFLNWADDLIMKRSIGWILIALTAITLVRTYSQNRRQAPKNSQTATTTEHASFEIRTDHRAPRYLYGTLGGFTTMAANAGGPVMSLYFLWAGFPVLKFLGTQAWFFFIINLIKLPFSASIGLLNVSTLELDLVLVPLVVAGALIGRFLAKRMNQEIFEPIIIVLTIISSVYLVF